MTDTINLPVPPQSREADMACLGSMLLGQQTRCIADVVSIVDKADFYTPANQITFSAIVGVYDQQQAVDSRSWALLRRDLDDLSGESPEEDTCHE